MPHPTDPTVAARNILVVAHTGRDDSRDAAVLVSRLLLDAGVRPVLSALERADLIAVDPELSVVSVLHDEVGLGDIELTIVLGGDGTILRAAEVTRGSAAPLLGVNLGHIGFLAESERDDLTETVERVVRRDYFVEERMTLSVRVKVGAEVVYETWALNEATVEKASRERMLEVVIEVDQRPLSSFGCDGVVISTPTGSTAYNFSAKPLVVGPESALAVEVLERTDGLGVLWCDGRRARDLQPGARVVVRRSSVPVRLARLHESTFTDRLVNKFRLPVTGWRGPVGREEPMTGTIHLPGPTTTGHDDDQDGTA
jgi:NAD+ kinase